MLGISPLLLSVMATKRKSRYAAAHPRDGIQLLPKTERQREYIEALKTAPQIIVTGPAGTGKTYISATHAARLFESQIVERIILTRPNVASGRSLGFFPGTMEEKIAPWVVPFTEVFEEHLGKDATEIAMKKGNIQIVPFEVMRGRTFKNAFVILDEAQNATAHELKMFLSRIGENAQAVLNGDISQSDLRNESGLKVIIDLIQKQKLPVPVIEFTLDDIVRSDICAMWIKAFHRAGI
jgi:phosphate starvation-inducible protein PhoH and related proteins